jgi:hypothetical protein
MMAPGTSALAGAFLNALTFPAPHPGIRVTLHILIDDAIAITPHTALSHFDLNKALLLRHSQNV